jgi:type IV pilus assembly protein PilY1
MVKLAKTIVVFLFISITWAMSFYSSCFASNATYAHLPPFISSEAQANVIFVSDYSGSMQFPAYYGSTFNGYYGSKVADTGYSWNNISESYDSTTKYYGYFDSDKYYSYHDDADNDLDHWYEDDDTTYSNREAGNKDSLSGNLLNFIVTSRIDAVLKNLIGGKGTCPSNENYCILKPQGAKRWVNVPNLNADINVAQEDYSTADYGTKDIRISVEGASSTIGTFSNRYARVKIASDDRSGIIQDNFDAVRFGFIAYADTSNDTAEQGMIKHGVHKNSRISGTELTEAQIKAQRDQNLDDLITALESVIPYSGTHTGEALREAYYYLTQDSSRQSYNSSYVNEANTVDPYYQERSDGTLDPAWCRKSFVVLISDGEWNGSIDPDTWAHNLKIDDLRETDAGGANDDFPGEQNASVYSLFAFSDSVQGEQSMKTVAAFGSYDEIDSCTSGTPYTFTESNNSKTNTFPRTNCTPGGTYNNCCSEWDSEDDDGVPDSFYYASDGQAMADALVDIFEEIRQGTSSGTAVTALTSRVSSGAAIAQAAFYPRKEFDDGNSVIWTGDVFAEWYLNGYIHDANNELQLVQNIREDTNTNFELNVESDRILEYLIESGDLTIEAFDSNSYGTKTDATADATYEAIEDVKNLFDAGEQLRVREPDDRTIYGVAEDNTLKAFTAANETDFDGSLGSTAAEFPDCLLDSNTPQYDDLINYTRGEDITNCRSRTTEDSTNENVWKLGDIIYSSPTIVEYDDYAMIYAGSNGGMLHAFRLGHIENTGEELDPAKLCDTDPGSCTHNSLGKEEWAFVPKDAMPYLRYMADPDYDHIYTVDLKPFIIDTGSQIILIGGMRFGGGCNNGDINPPTDTDPVGRSAYYALDITDPLNPEYLWRYAPDGLGFSYTGPAYVKRKDSNKDWHYYIIFGSGPTTFDGKSTQNLLIYTVDMLTGEEKDVFGDQNSEMNKNNSFSGRLFSHGLDVNEDGQTDFVFLGYTDTASGAYNKMKGGIIKIYTGSHDPTQWDYDTSFLTFAANPITAPVRSMNCFPDNLDYPYLYFGTGRYFTPDDKTQDGTNDINHLYGVPFVYDENNDRLTGGSGINSAGNSSDMTCSTVQGNANQAAWKIELEAAQGNYLRERSYSDPTVTDYNIVFFDTAQPTEIACESGGRSRSWVVNCATGKAIDDVICVGEDEEDNYVVDSALQFKYLVQLSGGDIQQHEDDEFTEETKRTTEWQEGVPSEQGGLPTFPPGSMLGTILYWKQW